MKTLVTAVLAIGAVTWLSPVFAAEQSVGEALHTLATLGDAKCSKAQQQVAAARNGGSPEIVNAMAGLEHMMCVCVPAQRKALQSSLSAQQLAAKISETDDVQARYLAEVVGKCGAEQFRANYADGCAESFAKTRPNSAKYCRCMAGVVAKLPDAEFITLAAALKSYGALADAAAKKGLPAPEPAPEAKQFVADERACRAP